MDDFKRREFIKLSALGFATIALNLNAVSSFAQRANAYYGNWNPDTKLNWDAFLERLTALARTQHELPWDQKAYADQVKDLLLQCNFPEFENVRTAIDEYENKNPNWFEATSLHDEVDFQISLFQFEKGEYIAHHDHPDMTGVINVVSGSALAKNYTIENDLLSSRNIITDGRTSVMNKCTIREVGNEIIKPGDVSILTAHEGNIHAIMPNEFTQLVDVFTPAYKADTKANWYTVNEDGFYEGREKLFEAEYVDTERSNINTIELSAVALDRCAGNFKISDNNYLVVTREGKKLFLQRGPTLQQLGDKTRLLPYEEDKFWMEGQDIRCVLNFNEEHSPESLSVYFSNGSITARKMK